MSTATEQIRAARELANSMKHSAGQWMVPGWDGYKCATLIDALAQRLEAAEKDAGRPEPMIEMMLKDMSPEDLRAKAAYLMHLNLNQARTIVEYEADAARYRYLVETCNVAFDPSEPWQLVIWEPSTGEDWKEKLDAAIDDARTALSTGGREV